MRCLAFALLWWVATPFTAPAHYNQRGNTGFTTVPPLLSQTVGSDGSDDGNDDTVMKLEHPTSGITATLVGTAHLSKASNEQVISIIESTRPDVIMVELDATRLERIGFKASGEDLGLPFSTADDILPPLQEDDKLAALPENIPWWTPAGNLFLDTFTQVARKLLTSMYNDMSSAMGDDMVGGGEFLAAINAAKNDTSCERIVLGDRDSLVTLRRAAELALRSGDFFGVLNRLEQVNSAEMRALEKELRTSMPGEGEGVNEADVTKALIETIKSDTEFRSRLFLRLEQEVPEFSRAFLTERDYIMAEAIRREGTKGANNVVAVVGLAHLPGIGKNLQAAWKDEATSLRSADGIKNEKIA